MSESRPVCPQWNEVTQVSSHGMRSSCRNADHDLIIGNTFQSVCAVSVNDLYSIWCWENGRINLPSQSMTSIPFRVGKLEESRPAGAAIVTGSIFRGCKRHMCLIVLYFTL